MRVIPSSAEFIDVLVSGRIVESTGAKFALEATVKDSTGRVWINSRRYGSPADSGSYEADAARTAGAIGGAAAVLSGLKKYSDAKVQAQALKELSDSFQSEVARQVVDVEGRTLKLAGTAEEQYREWRKLLHEIYIEENGGAIHAEAQPTTPAH